MIDVYISTKIMNTLYRFLVNTQISSIAFMFLTYSEIFKVIFIDKFSNTVVADNRYEIALRTASPTVARIKLIAGFATYSIPLVAFEIFGTIKRSRNNI